MTMILPCVRGRTVSLCEGGDACTHAHATCQHTMSGWEGRAGAHSNTLGINRQRRQVRPLVARCVVCDHSGCGQHDPCLVSPAAKQGLGRRAFQWQQLVNAAKLYCSGTRLLSILLSMCHHNCIIYIVDLMPNTTASQCHDIMTL